MLFAFGDFELDAEICELRRSGERIAVQPKVLATLRYLIEHRDRVVSKRELLDALWAGQHLNNVAVPWSVSHARKVLGQRRSDRGPIETVRSRGYRFVDQVSVALGTASGEARGSDETPDEVSTRTSFADPFVGRDEIMNQFMAALQGAKDGNGGLWLLTGDAGIGKTRCTTEFARVARRSGASVWMGRCLEAGGAPAFWPWIQLLREVAGDGSVAKSERREARELLRRLVPTEDHWVDASRRPTLSPSDASRFWLLQRLARSVRKLAEGRPRVLVFDDLHAADDGSLQTLTLLAADLAQSKMLVIGSARDPVHDDAGGGEKMLSQRLRPCGRVALSGLCPDDVETYMLGMTGRRAPPELTQAVHARTAGNPLFLREAVSLVKAHYERDGDVRPEDVKLPEVARNFLRNRLATLDLRERAILDVACAVGDEFDLAVLTRVTGLDLEDLLAGLDIAVRARFLTRSADTGKYGFVHGLLREVCYDELPSVRRVSLHGAIALALESLVAIEPRLNELAFHFYHALPAHHEQALHYGRLAGNASLKVLAHREANQFYSWALAAQRCAPGADTRTTGELLLASAIAMRRAGRVDESLQQCRRVLEIARREGFAELLVEATRLMRPTTSMARLPDPLALDALEHALTLLPEEAKAPRAQAYARLACIPPHSNDVEKSRELSSLAVSLARETGNSDVLIDVLSSRFHGLSGPDHIDEQLSVTDELLRLDAASRSWWGADAFLARYFALLQRGDMIAADRALEAFGQTSRQLRVDEGVWQYDRLRAQERLHAGDFDACESMFHELARRRSDLGSAPVRYFYECQLNALSIERSGRSLSSMYDATAWNRVQIVSGYQADRILYLIEEDRMREARVAFGTFAKNAFDGVTRDRAYLFTLAKLARASIALVDRDAARVLYDRLEPYPMHNATNALAFCLGSVSYFLGTLARFLDRPADAEAHFEEALAMNERIGYEPQVLRTQLALAGMLLRAPNGARVERSKMLVSNVRARAEALGMKALRSDAARLAQAS